MAHEPSASSGLEASGSSWIDLGGAGRSAWITRCVLLALLLGLPLVVAAFPAYGAMTGGDEADARAFAVAIGVLAALLLLLGGLLLAQAPRLLAEQGVGLDGRGIDIVRRAKWGSGPRTAFVPWADVHQIAWGLRPGRDARRTLELHLRTADGTMRLPRFATLVRPGEGGWGPGLAHARIVLDGDRGDLTRVQEEIAKLRPEFCGGAPSGDAAPRARPAAPAEEAGTVRRVNMRWQNALPWAVTTAVCLYLAIGSTVLTVVVAVVGRQVVGTLVMLALALLLGLLCRPLLRRAPHYTTRQEVAVDGAGITLLQEPQRRFSGRRIHIPWPQVRHIGQDVIVTSHAESRRTVAYLIDIDLSEDLPGAEVPTWASREVKRVRIRAGKRRHGEIVQALRASRPDLFQGA